MRGDRESVNRMPLVCRPERVAGQWTVADLAAVRCAINRTSRIAEPLGAALSVFRDTNMRDHDDRAAERLANTVASLNRRPDRVLIAVVAAARPQHPRPGIEEDRDIWLMCKLVEQNIDTKTFFRIRPRQVDRAVDEVELPRSPWQRRCSRRPREYRT